MMALFSARNSAGGTRSIHAMDWEEARDIAMDWASDANYPARCVVTVEITLLDEAGVNALANQVGNTISDTVEVGPALADPPCTAHQHDWQAPHHLVGGLESNPGVQGLTGTAILISEVCSHCGIRRHTHYAGSQRRPDELPETITYTEADERSLTWAIQNAS